MRKESIQDIEPAQAFSAQRDGAVLIDVRDEPERATGVIKNAVLHKEISLIGPGSQTLIFYCASGVRSAQAAVLAAASESLAQETTILNLRGGISAWRQAGLPVTSYGCFSDTETQRYARQIVLPQVGLEGQRRLKKSAVLLIGAGGLGSPAALYLAGAGVGRLRVVDDDVVDRSNLHRQILHQDSAAGQLKTESAIARLRALNPDIEVEGVVSRLTTDTQKLLLDGMDVVLDGSDNTATRQVSNRACVAAGIPLVYGAVAGFEGQVGVFHPTAFPDSACFACVFPDTDVSVEGRDCNVHGVLGVVPGLIGQLQATEVIKMILGIGEPLLGRLLIADVLAMEFRILKTRKNVDCPVCGSIRTGS